MTLLLELPPDLEARLEREATENGMNVNAYAVAKLSRPAETTPDPAETDNNPGAALLALVEEIYGSLPDEERKRLPPDYAENFRTYEKG